MDDTRVSASPRLRTLYHPDMCPWYGPVERWSGLDQRWIHDVWPGGYGDCPIRINLRRPECRDQAARVIARVLGVPVGATAPGWRYSRGWGAYVLEACTHTVYFFHDGTWGYSVETRLPGPSTSPILLDSPDRDALALAVVLRWLDEEVTAGRITVKETDHA
jgi:hypothetical protein